MLIDGPLHAANVGCILRQADASLSMALLLRLKLTWAETLEVNLVNSRLKNTSTDPFAGGFLMIEVQCRTTHICTSLPFLPTAPSNAWQGSGVATSWQCGWHLCRAFGSLQSPQSNEKCACLSFYFDVFQEWSEYARNYSHQKERYDASRPIFVSDPTCNGLEIYSVHAGWYPYVSMLDSSEICHSEFQWTGPLTCLRNVEVQDHLSTAVPKGSFPSEKFLKNVVRISMAERIASPLQIRKEIPTGSNLVPCYVRFCHMGRNYN